MNLMDMVTTLLSYAIGGLLFVGFNVVVFLYFQFKRSQHHSRPHLMTRWQSWQRAYLVLAYAVLVSLLYQGSFQSQKTTLETEAKKRLILEERIAPNQQKRLSRTV